MIIKLPEGYSFPNLVERAVRNAVPHTVGKAERWVAVRDTFATASTVAVEICNAYGLDPYKHVDGVDCSICNPQPGSSIDLT